MPYADHLYLRSDPGLTVVQDPDDPFDGSGGLRMDNDGFSFSNPTNIIHERLGPNFFVGETTGLIRTRVNVTDHPLASVREADVGIYFMASQLDLTGGTGSAYAFVLQVGTGFDWRLLEYTAGISISGVNTLDQGSTVGNPSLGKSMVMQVDWRLDPINIGGLRIRCKAGAGLDFGNMETVYQRTIASPLQTSLAEGLMYGDLRGQTTQITRAWFQDTFYSNYSANVIS